MIEQMLTIFILLQLGISGLVVLDRHLNHIMTIEKKFIESTKNRLIKGNATMFGCTLLLLLSMAMTGYLQIEKNTLERMSNRKRQYLCFLTFRQTLAPYLQKMSWFNRGIAASFYASSIPQTKSAALISLEALKKAQLLYHFDIIRRFKMNKNCSTANQLSMIAALPYSHFGAIKRLPNQQAMKKQPPWKLVFPPSEGVGMLMGSYQASEASSTHFTAKEREIGPFR